MPQGAEPDAAIDPLERLRLRWAGEPLAVTTGPATGAGPREIPFEYSARGDRVPGRLLLPKEQGPAPLVLLAHDASESSASAAIGDAVAALGGSAAAATIDLPLHGARASAKLSELAVDGLASIECGEPIGGGEVEGLVVELVHQAVLDLGRALDALASRAEIDAGRVAFVGWGLGARVGARFCAVEPRVRAAVLIGPSGGGPPEIDPCPGLAAIAPRPLLLLSAAGGAPAERAAAEAAAHAAGSSARHEWLETAPDGLPGAAFAAAGAFLGRALGRP